MEVENITILKGKITTILDQKLISDFKKINTSYIPKKLFNISILEDIKYSNPKYDEDELSEVLKQFD